jgi:uncharacterized membrane protein YdjX (TVP38/TMEM64 family)
VQQPTARDGTPSRSLARFLPLLLIGAAMVAVFATGAHRYLSLGALAEHRDRLQGFVQSNAAVALLAYVGIYVTAVALSIPGAVFLTIGGGFLFGLALGTGAALISATLGAICVFLIARTSIGDVLLRKAGPRVQRLAAGFREDAFSYLLLLRFLPVFPFWLTNLAPALFGVRLRTFALATLIGIAPGTFAFASAGAGLDSLIAKSREAQAACRAEGGSDCELRFDPKALLTPQLIAALVALGVVALIPIVLKRRFGQRVAALQDEKSAG